MQFMARKRRQAPAVIIISLIDILIVLLIFLMVTTTFKQFPSIKLALPESKQSKPGTSDKDNVMIVTISKAEPHFYLNTRAVTLSKLQEEFTRRAAQNTNASVAIRPDKDATVDDLLKVVEAADAAKIKRTLNIFVKPAGK